MEEQLANAIRAEAVKQREQVRTDNTASCLAPKELAEYIRLTKLANEWCWHEASGMTWICGNCKTDVGWRGDIANSVAVETLRPEIEIPTIKAALVALGLWDEFRRWCYQLAEKQMMTPTERDLAIFDMATDTKKFIQAVCSFLKSRNK